MTPLTQEQFTRNDKEILKKSLSPEKLRPENLVHLSNDLTTG